MLLPVITAKDICQPIGSYPVIYEDDTVQRALFKLQFSLCNSTRKRRHLLVMNRNDEFVGLLSLWDILALLQPDQFAKHQIDAIDYIKGWNISVYTKPSDYFIRQLMFWAMDDGWPSLEKHCERIADIKVKKLARTLKSCAVHQEMCLKEVASLMQKKSVFTLVVMKDSQLVGIIRAEDIVLEAARILINMPMINEKAIRDPLMMPLAHSP